MYLLINQKYKILINLAGLRLEIRRTANYCDINYNNISNRIKNVFGFTNILTLNRKLLQIIYYYYLLYIIYMCFTNSYKLLNLV